MVPPDPALAPVILPTIVPTVHVKVPGTLEVNAIPGPVPLHVLAVAKLVTTGVGSTVTITVNCVPVQLPDFGVTV